MLIPFAADVAIQFFLFTGAKALASIVGPLPASPLKADSPPVLLFNSDVSTCCTTRHTPHLKPILMPCLRLLQGRRPVPAV